MDTFQITAAVPLSRYWIGLSDEAREGSWFWGDSGTMLSPEISKYWSRGEPNNQGNEDCVEVQQVQLRSSKMNDQNCGVKVKFVCQYRLPRLQ